MIILIRSYPSITLTSCLDLGRGQPSPMAPQGICARRSQFPEISHFLGVTDRLKSFNGGLSSA